MESKQNRKNNKGFTLIELMVVISIIGFLASIILASLSSARDKAKDSKRIQDITQLEYAFHLYQADHNGQFPPVAKDSSYCIGFNDGSTCWGDQLVPGSTTLNNALAPYIKNVSDPSPTRGWGSGYLYLNSTYGSVGPAYHCLGSDQNHPGNYLIWRPEATPYSDKDCGGKGINACCGAAPCGNEGGWYCTVKLD